MKKYKLEDCPWCESSEYVGFLSALKYKNFQVACSWCLCRSALGGSKKEAAEKWNDVMGMVKGFKENSIPSSYD